MMASMDEWLSNGSMIDWILGAIVLESLFLAWLGQRRMKKLTVWMPGLLAGTALLITLRFAMSGFTWTWIAASLGLALVAHAVDMFYRFEIHR